MAKIVANHIVNANVMVTSFDQVQIESDPFRYCIKTWFNQKAFPFDTFTRIDHENPFVLGQCNLFCLKYSDSARQICAHSITNPWINELFSPHIHIDVKYILSFSLMSHVLQVTQNLKIKMNRRKKQQHAYNIPAASHCYRGTYRNFIICYL